MKNDESLRLIAETLKAKLLVSDLNKVGDVSVFLNSNRKKKLPPAIFVFQSFSFLASVKYSNSTCRVLFFLLSKAEYQNYFSIHIKTISEQIDMSKKSVIEAVKELTKSGVIVKFKNENDHRCNDYFLNPFAAWKGSSVNRSKSIKALAVADSQISLFDVDIHKLMVNEKKK